MSDDSVSQLPGTPVEQLRSLRAALGQHPLGSIEWHVTLNHLSTWLWLNLDEIETALETLQAIDAASEKS